MKFMKLGTRPDTFISLDESTRSVASDIPTDVTVQVDHTRFLLHKFPLLSRCSHLRKFHHAHPGVFELPGFPGGAAAFELCAKFCYGITVTLSAANIVAAMSAAAYLEMTEEQERGNFLGKLESFLTSCLLRRWKDALATLRSTARLPEYPDHHRIATRCAAALAGMAAGEPPAGATRVPWWAEDLAELGLREFSPVVAALRGRVPGKLVAEALRVYLRRWPPEAEVLEEVARLLPQEKGAVRCGLLIAMLKAAGLVGMAEEARMELVRRAAEELEAAAVREIAAAGDMSTVAEVVREFMRSHGGAEENVVKVGRLVDGWLKERAGDDAMTVEKVVEVAEMVPEWARNEHDDLYKAIDLHLKANPGLGKSERKRLCRVLDCKKLSVETCAHAAQNDRLPLRVVVQVLFFEQARAIASGTQMAELPPNIKALLATGATAPSENSNPIATPAKFGLQNGGLEDEWSIKCGRPTLRMKLAEDENGLDGSDEDGDDAASKASGLIRSSSSRFKALCLRQEKTKSMLGRLWSMNRSTAERH